MLNATHIIDYAPAGLIEAARATWDTYPYWHQYPCGKRVSKCGCFNCLKDISCNELRQFPRAIEALIYQMSTLPIRRLFNLNVPVFPDLEYMHGAGMHELNAGVSLALHKDTDRHPCYQWKREETAILYLDTHDSGGELDFTDI